MGQQDVRVGKHVTVAYNSNNVQREDLERGWLFREIYIRLTCTPTLSGANNVYANILKGDEWAVVKQIRIVANNNDTLYEISGEALRWLNYFENGVFPRVSPLLGAGGANPVCESVVMLPIWSPNSIKPFDTMLDTADLASLKIEIEWGTFTDIAASATAWTTEPSIDVFVLESFGVKADFTTRRIHREEKVVDATSSQFTMQLPVNKTYRAFLINTVDGVLDQNDIINNMKIKSGQITFVDMSEIILREVLPLRRGIVRPWDGTAYSDITIGDNGDLDGWYFVDLVTDGFLEEAINTFGFSDFKLEFDVTVGAGTTKIYVWPITLESPIANENTQAA